jgi:hypothetical protein
MYIYLVKQSPLPGEFRYNIEHCFFVIPWQKTELDLHPTVYTHCLRTVTPNDQMR